MCGIAGIVSLDQGKVQHELLQRMTDAIAHRGPDAEGHWISSNGRVGLGHRRLSILDLSEEGTQPMHYLDRYSIVFNGEIYNYIEIRKKLIDQGYRFHSATDTEVVLASYDMKGQECLDDFDGMFAFVIYDRLKNTCFGARDRFGEKPFFYYRNSTQTFFASEIKALWAAGVPKEISSDALYNYLSQGIVSDPQQPHATFYKNIYKIPQAHFFTLDVGTGDFRISSYWNIDLQACDRSITEQQAVDRFRELFYLSVTRRLRSDVPVGSSLSGGLDSSSIVNVMHEIGSDGIYQKTFSARFPGFKKDESAFQDLILKQTNAEAHFVYPTDQSMINNLDKIVHAQDEPFASASIAVQYEVFELARKNGVTVMLDGQGADETLAGYHAYYHSYFHELKSKYPSAYKKEYEAYISLHEGNEINARVERNALHYIKHVLSSPLYHRFKHLYLQRKQSKKLFTASFEKENGRLAKYPKEHFNDLNSALYYSTFNYGLEDLLRYADRNAMAHAVEVRLPYLQHDLVSFLYSLPPQFKIHKGWTKWIQRISFESQLPDELTWRKDKIGYEPPQKSWMENEVLQEEILDSIEKMTLAKVLHQGVAGKLESLSNEEQWRILMVGRMTN